MAKLLTTQDMIEGHLDTQTLKEAVNEDKMVTSRLGKEFASLPMASRLLVENGLLGATPYETYDDMVNNTTMVNGDYAVVTNDDNLSRNGVYVRSLGGYKFLKYNNLSQAKTYTDEKVAENNPSARSFPMTDGVNSLGDDYKNERIIYLTGAITSDATLELPKSRAIYIIQHLSSGNDRVFVRCEGSSKQGIEIKKGEVKQIFNSGADAREVNNYGASTRSPVLTGVPEAPTAEYGERTNQIANTNYVWGAARGSTAIELTDSNKTLSLSESAPKSLVFTGTLTKDVTITLPNSTGDWNLRNSTSGGYDLYVKGVNQTSAFIRLEPDAVISCFALSYILREVGRGGSNNGGNTPLDSRELVTQSFNLKAENSNKIPVALSPDGLRVLNQNSRYMQYSDDFGKNWITYNDAGSLTNSPYVHFLDNGEIAYIATDTSEEVNKHTVRVSRGANEDIQSATWIEGVSVQKQGVSLNGSWGFYNYKNIILVAEYGGKVGYPTSGLPDGAPAGGNARYVYMSLDYGETWSTVFDLNEHATTDGVHVHGVAYDPWWQRVWVTYGDSSNATMYSDDLGETWKIADYYGTSGSDTQVVGIKPMKDCILFGSDSSPNGIQRINRSEGKHTTDGRYTMELAHRISDDAGLAYLCHAITQSQHSEDNPVLFGFGCEIQSRPSKVVATYDGYKFFDLWTDSISQPVGRGVRNVIGVTPKNEIIVASNDERVAGKWSQITIKV